MVIPSGCGSIRLVIFGYCRLHSYDYPCGNARHHYATASLDATSRAVFGLVGSSEDIATRVLAVTAVDGSIRYVQSDGGLASLPSGAQSLSGVTY